MENVYITTQPSQAWTLNTNYDGDTLNGDVTDATDHLLLSDLGSLLIGEKAVFQIQATVIPGTVLTYNNSASGEGKSTVAVMSQ